MTNENDKRNVAVIAGMAAGFGETLARELSQAGYAVAGLSRTAAKVSDLAQEIGHSGSLYRDYACNLGNADQVAHTFKEIEIAHGAPSVLIYNAMQLVAKPFAELTPEDFEQSWRST
jgi:NAD(P)-dependent dehydrogenase (short-subunit alcohol dehydrogenase family)